MSVRNTVQEFSIDIKNKLQNPDTDFRVSVHNTDFPTEAFNSTEAELFNNQLNTLFSGIQSGVLSSVLQERSEMIANVAAYAKSELDAKNFGGINAGDNEIGFSELRPGHILSDDSGTVQNDWYFEPDSAGWNDWIGDGTQANNYSIGDNQVSVVFAFVDQDVSSEVSALNIDEWDRSMDMLPHDLNSMTLRDNDNDVMVQPLPTLVATDGADIHARLKYDRKAESQPRLYGVTFGLGEYLNTEDY